MNRILLALILQLMLASANAAEFPILERLRFEGAPDFSTFGIEPITVLGDVNLGYEGVPENDRIAAVLKTDERSDIIVVNIERWRLDTPEQRSVALRNFETTLERFRKVDQKVKLGIYSMVPVRDYWRAIGSRGSKAYQAWQDENTQMKRLADMVDVLFPSLYTFYDDPENWLRYAEANLSEARRVADGKPVYCFLWPQFHGSLEPIPGNLWRLQLETCYRLADGIVMWGAMKPEGSSTGRPHWEPNAAWWLETVSFVESVRGREKK
jgi:hypothetical protein